MKKVIKAINELNETMKSIRQELAVLSLPEDCRKIQRQYYLFNSLSEYWENCIDDAMEEMEYAKSDSERLMYQKNIDDYQKWYDRNTEQKDKLIDKHNWILT
jgi:hypothetical protein